MGTSSGMYSAVLCQAFFDPSFVPLYHTGPSFSAYAPPVIQTMPFNPETMRVEFFLLKPWRIIMHYKCFPSMHLCHLDSFYLLNFCLVLSRNHASTNESSFYIWSALQPNGLLPDITVAWTLMKLKLKKSQICQDLVSSQFDRIQMNAMNFQGWALKYY
eukprot:Gb_38144 [translate_table: standard]